MVKKILTLFTITIATLFLTLASAQAASDPFVEAFDFAGQYGLLGSDVELKTNDTNTDPGNDAAGIHMSALIGQDDVMANEMRPVADLVLRSPLTVGGGAIVSWANPA